MLLPPLLLMHPSAPGHDPAPVAQPPPLDLVPVHAFARLDVALAVPAHPAPRLAVQQPRLEGGGLPLEGGGEEVVLEQPLGLVRASPGCDGVGPGRRRRGVGRGRGWGRGEERGQSSARPGADRFERLAERLVVRPLLGRALGRAEPARVRSGAWVSGARAGGLGRGRRARQARRVAAGGGGGERKLVGAYLMRLQPLQRLRALTWGGAL